LPATAGPDIFNTDQGSQFTSFAFTTTLKDAGIRISMDGRGRWMDNVFIERLWRSLKYECVFLSAFVRFQDRNCESCRFAADGRRQLPASRRPPADRKRQAVLTGGRHINSSHGLMSLPVVVGAQDSFGQRGTQPVVDKSHADSVKICFCKRPGVPVENYSEALVFLPERQIRRSSCIGVDGQRHASLFQPIYGMVGIGGKYIDLDVAGWADFQVDAMLKDEVDESGIFDAADPVTDTTDAQLGDHFAYAVCPERFAGMSGDADAALGCAAENRDVLSQAMTGLVPSQVYAADSIRRMAFGQRQKLKALRRVVGPQRAKDEARFDWIAPFAGRQSG
jgi:hypothetical protein